MTIESVILNRRTEKVLCEVDAHRSIPVEVAERNRKIVLQALRVAGWAPFHYERQKTGLAEPWRAHILWHDDVKKVALYLRDDELEQRDRSLGIWPARELRVQSNRW